MHKVFKPIHDPIWELELGVIIIIALQWFTNSTFLPYNRLYIIGLELILLAALAVATAEGYKSVSPQRRSLALTLTGIIAGINVFSLIFLIDALIFGGSIVSGKSLLFNGLAIYFTNIFMFALLFWEMDGGGPDRRVAQLHRRDFVFTQMIHPQFSKPDWLPRFTDYLYLSTTNVTNLAPADTVPNSGRAKLLLGVQSLVSLTTIALVVSRSISILH